MYRSSSNRIFPIILVIVVMIAVIAGLVTVARYLFFSGGNGDKEAEQSRVETARDQLLTLGNDRSVRITVRGPIVADEKFRTKRIEIAPTSRVYTIFEGYLEKIEDQKSYNNNMEAYEEFVHALDKADFTKQDKRTADNEEEDDLRGICATGKLYEYEILGPSGVVEKLWTSTCKGSPGTFAAHLPQVNNLFMAQIPTETLNERTTGGLRLGL